MQKRRVMVWRKALTVRSSQAAATQSSPPYPNGRIWAAIQNRQGLLSRYGAPMLIHIGYAHPESALTETRADEGGLVAIRLVATLQCIIVPFYLRFAANQSAITRDDFIRLYPRVPPDAVIVQGVLDRNGVAIEWVVLNRRP